MLVDEPMSIPPQEVSISKSSSAGASRGLGAKSQASVEGCGWLYRVSLKWVGCGPDQNWEECAKWSPGPPQKPYCYHAHVKEEPGPHHSRLLLRKLTVGRAPPLQLLGTSKQLPQTWRQG